jgi:hypothetical protein
MSRSDNDEFAHVANMQGVALLEGPMPMMSAAEVTRQGYAAFKSDHHTDENGHKGPPFENKIEKR